MFGERFGIEFILTGVFGERFGIAQILTGVNGKRFANSLIDSMKIILFGANLY